mgnify:CR=1 FL=1
MHRALSGPSSLCGIQETDCIVPRRPVLRGEWWAPGTPAVPKPGGVHVFSVTEEVRDDELGPVVAWLLGRTPSEVRLRHDGFGRPRLDAEAIALSVCRDQGTLLLALSAAGSVALSAATVPASFGTGALLPFTRAEREHAERTPADRRTTVLTQLWTRKEAALRLVGRGGFARAAELDVLVDGTDGSVLVPQAGMLGAGGTAYVGDLPAAPGTVASLATSEPAGEVRVWQVRCPVPVGS